MLQSPTRALPAVPGSVASLTPPGLVRTQSSGGVREGPEEGTLGASVLFCSISVIVVWNVLSWGDERILKSKAPGSRLLKVPGC